MSRRFANYPSLATRGVLITDGASGIGASLIQHFARQGVRVGFVDFDDTPVPALLETLSDVPRQPVLIHCDVTDLAALTHAIEQLRTAVGPFGVLINSAAHDVRHSLDDVCPDFFATNIAVNLRHQVFVTKAAIADMKQLGGGSVICMGSTGWIQKKRRLSAVRHGEGRCVRLRQWHGARSWRRQYPH